MVTSQNGPPAKTTLRQNSHDRVKTAPGLFTNETSSFSISTNHKILQQPFYGLCPGLSG